MPGKFRAAQHQLLKLTFRSASKVSEDAICKGLVSRHWNAYVEGSDRPRDARGSDRPELQLAEFLRRLASVTLVTGPA